MKPLVCSLCNTYADPVCECGTMEAPRRTEGRALTPTETSLWYLFACACCGLRLKSRKPLDDRISSHGACKCCGSGFWDLGEASSDKDIAAFKARHEQAVQRYKRLPAEKQL